ncbi:MFS transporter [Terrabacter aerolatus]|uniref:MFS transporter n=1 Tax=Terrabacter aerolatus TaxID=422442 RepID=A0A512D503_9MICO|nr:MFS transporter [Terrabacter aerolatus]
MLALVAFTAPLATVGSVAASLGADVAGRTWVLNSMGVGLGATLLTAGTLADDRGRRRVLVTGLLVLTGSSVVAAVAGATLTFVLARVAQGVGAAAVVAASLGLVAHWFESGPARAAASGVWGASVGGGIALGPLLASSLDRWASWREVYWLLAVASLSVAAAARAALEETRSHERRPLDVPGAGLLALSTTTFLAALVEGRSGWGRPVTLVLLGAAVLAGVALVLVERQVRFPMVDPALLRHGRFVAATAAGLATGAGIIGLLSFLPGFLALALAMAPTTAAVLFLAWSGTSVVLALLARRLPARWSGRAQLGGSLVVVALGQLALSGIAPGDSWTRFVPGLLVAGVGSGVLNAALGREAVASVPDGRGGMGSGANNTARYLGSSVGVTVVSVVVAAHAVPGSGAAGLVAGWNVAACVTAGLSLAGAVAVWATTVTDRRRAVTVADVAAGSAADPAR